MKKKLSQAIAVATLVGAAGAANAAMYVNDKGLGDVLLYPLYSADAGNDTYFSVTNTTGEFKAVKVRMLEHKNSQEVLDFNLYLSPYDQWSAAITLNSAGNPVIKTYDTSCTYGSVGSAGVQFRNFEYRLDSDESLARAAIGHIELIEMGNLDKDFELMPGVTVADAIEHVDGVPGNCGVIKQAFEHKDGGWKSDVNVGLTPTADGASGLYGTGSIINVDGAWQASYDAVALANTYDALAASYGVRHALAGTIDPDFSKLTPEIVLFNGTNAVTYELTDDNKVAAGFNAVSALLSKSAIMNDYVAGAGLNAQTDFVITFPTKKTYVNGPDAPVSPFTQAWKSWESQACESVNLNYWDHEENQITPEVDDFSPPRPVDEANYQLCYETNFLHVGADSNLFGGDEGHQALKLEPGYEKGWINIDFVTEDGAHVLDSEAEEVTFEGMPVIGFSTIAVQNGDVGGLLSNYASTYEHKSKQPVVVTP